MTSIEWTDETWNPTTGCDRISPGCDHCYALTLANRLKRMGQPAYQRDGDPRTSGPGFGLTLHPDRLDLPRRWRRPRLVFVNSMSDLFHKQVPAEFIARVFDVMGDCPQHTFQVLTKRPKRMARLVAAYYEANGRAPYPNVWLGTSIETRKYVWRADWVRRTPAAVRFISAEPLLGPLVAHTEEAAQRDFDGRDQLDLTGIDWLIVGGESGKGHRPLDLQWVRDLRDEARSCGTAYFLKQLGGHRPGSALEDLPVDLRIRDWPAPPEQRAAA